MQTNEPLDAYLDSLDDAYEDDSEERFKEQCVSTKEKNIDMKKIKRFIVLFLRQWWPNLGRVRMSSYHDYDFDEFETMDDYFMGKD